MYCGRGVAGYLVWRGERGIMSTVNIVVCDMDSVVVRTTSEGVLLTEECGSGGE